MNDYLSLRAPFDALEPKEILYFFDEPIVFTSIERGDLFLCLRTSADNPPEFLVVPIDGGVVARLQAGSLSLRSAFMRSLAWHVTADLNYRVQNARWLAGGNIPDELLPEEGAGLYPHHGTVIDEYNSRSVNQFLSVSFKGGSLKSGTMPLGTLKSLVDDVYSSMRQIFAPVVSRIFSDEIGEAAISKILQIPVYQPEFASLNLSFAAPALDVSALKKAVDVDVSAWMKEANEATQKFMASAELIARLASDDSILTEFAYSSSLTLEILSKMAPSQNTPFETLEIRGRAGAETERKIVIDVAKGERISAAFNLASRGDQTISGVIVDTNARSGTIIVRRENGRETTCELGKRIMNSEPIDIRNNAEVTVTGSLTTRARRDRMVVRRIVLKSGRAFVRAEGEAAFMAE